MEEKEGCEKENIEISVEIEGKKFDAVITATNIILRSTKDSKLVKYIEFKDVLQARALQQHKNGKGNTSDNPFTSVLVLDYVNKHGIDDPRAVGDLLSNSSSNFLWEPAKVMMQCSTSQFAMCEQITDSITDYIVKNETQRPKNLLVFINPVGGRKKGVSIYEKTVCPLFQLAGIKTDVIVTSSASHATEVLRTFDISKVDGIVCVGGDGTFTQVVNALVKRTAQDHQLDLNDVEVSLPQLPLKIGIIPAGTEMLVNLMSVHNNGFLVHYGSMQCSYGFFGDAIRDSESIRYLGGLRYPVAMFKNFVKLNKYELEVEFKCLVPRSIPSDTKSEGTKCEDSVNGCHSDRDDTVCAGQQGAAGGGTATVSCSFRPGTLCDGSEWHKVRGDFIMVNIWMWDMIGININEEDGVNHYVHTSKSWSNGALFVHMADGTTSRMGLLKHLKEMVTKGPKVMEPNISMFGCEGYRLIIVPPKSCMKKSKRAPPSSSNEASSVQEATSSSEDTFAILNIDGDPFKINHPCVEVRLRRHMLKIFGSGLDEELFKNLKDGKQKK